MKTNKLILNLFALAAAVTFAAGCASTGNDKSASTVKSLTQSSSLLEQGSLQIDQTLAKLNDLVSHPDADLQKQFAAFDASVNELDATAKSVCHQADQIKAQGDDYLANWDKESAKMNNEDIRQRSQARKQEVAANFARISEQSAATKAAFQPFMSDLRDIQSYLNTDLTAGGVSAIKSTTAKATSDAIPLKESIRTMDAAFKGLKSSLSTSSGVVN